MEAGKSALKYIGDSTGDRREVAMLFKEIVRAKGNGAGDEECGLTKKYY